MLYLIISPSCDSTSQVSENQMRMLGQKKKKLITLFSVIVEEKVNYFQFSFFCYEHGIFVLKADN